MITSSASRFGWLFNFEGHYFGPGNALFFKGAFLFLGYQLRAEKMNVTEAEQIAISLMRQHGLIEIGWNFRFDKATRRFGLCDYTKRFIQLAKPLVEINPVKAVTNTILHEIAHALVGPYHGHDEVWRAKSIQIGCDGKRCHNDQLPIHNAKYVGICPGCYTLHPSSKPPTRTYACPDCCRKFNNSRFTSKFQYQWKPHGEPFDVAAPADFLPADRLVTFLHVSSSIINPQSVVWCLNRFRLPTAFFVQTEYATEQLTKNWSKEKNINMVTVNGSYAVYPKSLKPFAATLFNRNREEILSRSDLLTAIWDGVCSESRDFISGAIKNNKPTLVFNFGKKKISDFHFEKNFLLEKLKIQQKS